MFLSNPVDWEFDVVAVYELHINRVVLLQQERTMGNANGTSPLDNMRSLEHYLNDLVRGAGDTPDHLKGKGRLSLLFMLRLLGRTHFRQVRSCQFLTHVLFVKNR